ncbi:hypothetical protein [Flavobacterium sp. GSB-24]|uniref:hypothetical protein n=1 Tax=Flavobacterium sp. GSB-24 TaxID=2994319 RepID=UPI002493164A|nr:hypothetical protein [Flavobacterium sp. GSB-24]BDU26906.1 hypothetical protein FLGSB24_36500 [Flavobacterium sp. GSB-24]
MELNKIITILEENNYKYDLKSEKIVVALDLSQEVIIDFSNPKKTIISDQLTNWNFLTGCFKISLKNAILYNFILLLFFGFFCQYAKFINQDFTSLLLIFIAWILLFAVYYLIKLENFKLQLLLMTK